MTIEQLEPPAGRTDRDATRGMPRLRRLRRGHAIVAILALVLYVPGVWWGAPHVTAPDRIRPWGVDDETPLGPLAEIHNILEPKPDRNLGYPLMYSFMVAAAYSPYIGWLVARGELRSPSPVFPYGFDDPSGPLAVLAGIAHLVTMLTAVVTGLAAYDAGRVAAGARGGALFAALALLAFPMVYYARTGNVDVPMLCFMALAFAAFTRCVVHGVTMRRCIALGAAAGFALATKEAALGAFLPMPFVLLALRRRELNDAGGMTTSAAWRPLLAGLGTALLALGAGSGLFVDPGRYIAHVQFISGRLDTLAEGGTQVIQTFPYTFSGHVAYAGALILGLADILTWPGLLLALAGGLLATLRRERLALLLLPALAYIAWMFLVLRAAQLRYMLPGAFLLSVFAAYAVVRAGSWRTARYAAGVVVAFILSVQVLRALDLTHQMINDSRYAASAWLAQRLAPGDRIEHFGPAQKLPPLETGVVSAFAAPYHGMYVTPDVGDSAIAQILAGWAQRRPSYVLSIPDFTSEPDSPYSRSFPPPLYEAMLAGESSYTLVAFFQTPRLLPWLRLPRLDYPTVNPPIRIFAPADSSAGPGRSSAAPPPHRPTRFSRSRRALAGVWSLRLAVAPRTPAVSGPAWREVER